MRETNIDDLLAKAKNKFLLSNAAAGRAKQILEGSLPYIDYFDASNPIITALREISAGRIEIKAYEGKTKKPQKLLIEEKEVAAPITERLARKSIKKSVKPVKKKK